MSTRDDDDENEDTLERLPHQEVLEAELDLLREQQRSQGKRLGELEERFNTMDEHLGKISGLVKQALHELDSVFSQEKTTVKPG